MPTPSELQELEQAFSRDGFTQGYFDDRKGPEMFGVRDEKTPEPKELFAQARQTYQNQENGRVGVKFYAMLRPNEPVRVGVEDPEGRVVTAQGPVPQAAQNLPMTCEQVEKQLSRTGGTPYISLGVKALVEDGLNVPLAALNSLRRQVLEELSKQRQTLPKRHKGSFKEGVRYENRREAPELTVSVRKAGQVSPDLLRLAPAILYVPVGELAANPQRFKELSRETTLVPALPRIAWDREGQELKEQLKKARDMGCDQVLTGDLGLAAMAHDMGFDLRGDFGLPVFNAQALKELKRLGFLSATASFELKLAQIRDLSKAMPVEAIVYGRLPLMITENCIIKNRAGRCVCEGENILTDRKGERFPVVKAVGCRSEILNSKKLFLADKPEWKKCGLTYARLMFTTENPWECVQALERYQEKNDWAPPEFTRGLYYRGVE